MQKPQGERQGRLHPPEIGHQPPVFHPLFRQKSRSKTHSCWERMPDALGGGPAKPLHELSPDCSDLGGKKYNHANARKLHLRHELAT